MAVTPRPYLIYTVASTPHPPPFAVTTLPPCHPAHPDESEVALAHCDPPALLFRGIICSLWPPCPPVHHPPSYSPLVLFWQLKVGTSHVLGMNVVLPELPSETVNTSPPQVSTPPPKTPLQRTSFYEGTRAQAPRRGESQPAEAQEPTPSTSKKRKGSFGGAGNDEQQVHSFQAERKGAALFRTSARKRSRVSKAGGARTPGSDARGVGHDTGGMADNDSLDSRWCGEAQGGSSTARNASRSSRLRGGGVDGVGCGGDFSAGQDNADGGMGAREVKRGRTWWGWRFPTRWGREASGEILLPNSSPAPCPPIQQQQLQQRQQQQSTQTQEVSPSGMNGVQASVPTTYNDRRGVYCDTNNISPQESERRSGAAGRRGAMGGGAPSSDYGVSREIGGSPPLKRSPLVITVVLASPPGATPA